MARKICMIVANTVVGVEPRAEREAAALVEQGDEVVIIGVARDGTPPGSFMHAGYRVVLVDIDHSWAELPTPRRLFDGFRDRTLGAIAKRNPERWDRWKQRYFSLRYPRGLPAHLSGEPTDPLHAASAPAQDEDKAQDDSVHEDPKLGGERTLERDLYEMWRLLTWNVCMARAALAEKADVYHAHDLMALLAAAICRSSNGSQLVYDSHEVFMLQTVNMGRGRMWRAFHRSLESRIAQRADLCFTVNESIADWLRESTGAEWDVVRNIAANLSIVGDFDPDHLPQPAPDELVALFHGGLGPGRGLEQLIDSVPFFDKGISLWIRGPSPADYLAGLRSRVARLGLQDRVRFVPPVPMRALVAAASSAHLGLLPYLPASVNNYYSLPNKLFEYFAAGLPVLSTDLPEIRAIVAKHDVGLLIDMRNPREIANAVNLLMADPELRKRMAANSRAAADGDYHWDHERDHFLELYSDL